jgi:hypothetical protein
MIPIAPTLLNRHDILVNFEEFKPGRDDGSELT